MSENKKCPICEGVMKNKIWSHYDEPPESKYECDVCGYTEYYFYYDGTVRYVEYSVFDEKMGRYVPTRICYIDIEEMKDPNDLKEYKSLLLKELKEIGLTVEEIIQLRKDYKDLQKKERLEKINKAKEDSSRWKNEEFNEEEILKIHEFLSKEKEKLEEFVEKDIVVNLKFYTSKEFLTNVSYELSCEKSLEYQAKKQQSQLEYTRSTGTPMFASSRCFRCGTAIFGVEKGSKTLFGKSFPELREPISMETCSSKLITGCPVCNRSYVD